MATPLNYGSYPLKDIPAPHAHDVLCGRGGGSNNWIGNSHWRMLVAANKQLYVTLPKRQKQLLSRSIVNAVRSQNPPGRFLQKDSKTNKWYDVGDQRAQEKTSQALREGAPDIRKKVAGQGEEADDDSAKNSDEDKKSATSAEKESKTAASTPAPAPPAAPQPKPASPTSAPQTTPSNPMGNPSMQQNPFGVMPGGPFPMGGAPPVAMPMQMFGQGNMVPQIAHHGMLVYGPNMQPMQIVPTMVMNEHGMMVPGMSMIPATHAQMQMMPPPPVQHQVSGTDSAVTQHASNSHDHHYNNEGNHSGNHSAHDAEHTQPSGIPTFDEYVAAPPEGLEGGCLSFGSATMTDAEMMKLQANGPSFGSIMNYNFSNSNHNRNSATAGNNQNGQSNDADDEPVPHAMNHLESTGISFGDVSMMSTGTNRLEAGGTSFGTMMSLEAVGTSFGSLSLDPNNREQLFQALELIGGGPEIPPMFGSADKATGNLLECSDTESEGSQSNKPELTAQKSEAWERMRMSVAQTQLQQSQSKGTVNSTDLMPPPMGSGFGDLPGMSGTVLSVPTPSFERDFSQLSAWGYDDHDGGHDGDDEDDAAAAPPPQLAKQGSDGDEALVGIISRVEV